VSPEEFMARRKAALAKRKPPAPGGTPGATPPGTPPGTPPATPPATE
jgi:hypothetical protein